MLSMNLWGSSILQISRNYFKKSRVWDNLACVLLKQQRLKSFPVYHCQCLCEVTGWHIVCSHWRLTWCPGHIGQALSRGRVNLEAQLAKSPVIFPLHCIIQMTLSYQIVLFSLWIARCKTEFLIRENSWHVHMCFSYRKQNLFFSFFLLGFLRQGFSV